MSFYKYCNLEYKIVRYYICHINIINYHLCNFIDQKNNYVSKCVYSLFSNNIYVKLSFQIPSFKVKYYYNIILNLIESSWLYIF